METIKKYAGFVGAAIIAILSALLLRKSRQLDSTQSELITAKTDTEIKLNDQATEAARANADDLVAEYERSKR